MGLLRICVLFAGLVTACVFDWRSRRIPNLIPVGLAAAAVLLHVLLSGPGGLWTWAVGLFVGLVLGMLLWMLGLFRAGDAKLLAAIFAMMGWRWGLGCFVWSLLAGAVVGVVMLLVLGQLPARMKKLWQWGKSVLYSRAFVPYPVESGKNELPFALCFTLGAGLMCFAPVI